MTNFSIDSEGTKIWRDKNGKRHRDDGPAVEHLNGGKIWYRHGEWHCTKEPAIQLGYSSDFWFVDNKLIDINPILERLDISPDWRNWTEEEKFLVRLALS